MLFSCAPHQQPSPVQPLVLFPDQPGCLSANAMTRSCKVTHWSQVVISDSLCYRPLFTSVEAKSFITWSGDLLNIISSLAFDVLYSSTNDFLSSETVNDLANSALFLKLLGTPSQALPCYHLLIFSTGISGNLMYKIWRKLWTVFSSLA